jgi:hypothetical protein
MSIERKQDAIKSTEKMSAEQKQILTATKELERALDATVKGAETVNQKLTKLFESVHQDAKKFEDVIGEIRKALREQYKDENGKDDKTTEAWKKYNCLTVQYKYWKDGLAEEIKKQFKTRTPKTTKGDKQEPIETTEGATVHGNSQPPVTTEVFNAAVIASKVEMLKEILAHLEPVTKQAKKSSDKEVQQKVIAFQNHLVEMLNEME